MERTENKFKVIWRWFYRVRGLILAIPVLIVALVLALQNIMKLPQSVTFSTASVNDAGLLVFQNVTITKTLAVWGPFGLTAACLALMLVSRRVVYPWLISIFTLVLPFVLYWINIFQ